MKTTSTYLLIMKGIGRSPREGGWGYSKFVLLFSIIFHVLKAFALEKESSSPITKIVLKDLAEPTLDFNFA